MITILKNENNGTPVSEYIGQGENDAKELLKGKSLPEGKDPEEKFAKEVVKLVE